MASCVGNIRTKNYQNLITVFQVTVKNVGDVFFETQCTWNASVSIHCLAYGQPPTKHSCWTNAAVKYTVSQKNSCHFLFL